MLRPSRCLLGLLLVIATLLPAAAQAQGAGGKVPEPTGIVTFTPAPTQTPEPTVTPAPSATLEPSVTPAPTFTPEPSATATASATPAPSMTATASPTPLPLDTYEPDDRARGAARLVTGQVQSRTFASPHGPDQDWVRLLLVPGRWRVIAATSTGQYDPRLVADERVVGENEGSNGKDAHWVLQVKGEQEFLFSVVNVGIDGLGQYTLTLERLGDLPTVTPTPSATPGPGGEDGWEPDAPPAQPGYSGSQPRTFNPAGDVDYLRYRLKANLATWIETSDLTGGADTLLHVYQDEDGLLTATDPLLAWDDDGGAGLGSRVRVDGDADTWLTIVIQNQGTGWGPGTGYTLRVLTAEQVTPTPSRTAAPTTPGASPLPTYTPYPTFTPVATATALPVPSATVAPVPAPSGSTSRTGAAADPQMGGAGVAAVPVPPTPLAASALLRLHLFIDASGDGLLGPGEGMEGVRVVATTRDRLWQVEAYAVGGEVHLPLATLPSGAEVVLLVPYLHRSATLNAPTGADTSTLALPLPELPLYLP